MAEPGRGAKDPPGLDVLGQKVQRATSLIGQLRERIRALAAEIEELRGRLESPQPERSANASESRSERGGGAPATGTRGAALPPPSQGGGDPDVELRLLRRERQEIRERLSRLLTELEEL